MNDLLFNSDGQLYINTNMKLLSLSVLVKRRFITLSQSLQQQLTKCQTNKCISRVQKKIIIFQTKQQQILNKLQQVNNKLQLQYILCNDMIYENDIRICRKQTKQKWFRELKYFVNNQINLQQLATNINSVTNN